MLCYLYPDPTYLFFGEDLPDLLYYSHIPSVIIALLVGSFVYFNGRQILLNKLLLLIALCFSLWVALSLLVWAGNDGGLFISIWPLFGILAAFLSIFSIYFIYVFLNKQDAGGWMKFTLLLLLLPVLLFAHTDLSVSGFDIALCDAFQYEGFAYKMYYNALGFLAMAWILVLLYRAYRTADATFKKQILYMGLGIEFFLFSFITIVFIVTQLTAVGLLEDSRLEFYGLFGMTFFMVMMGILIVKFHAFNAKLLGAQALVGGLIILIGSEFFFVESRVNIILVAVTFVLSIIGGYFLVRSVKKEVEQREEIAKLAESLAKANERLKVLDKLKSEFVSIASHQLRSPLTAIRGYASMLVEGSYGKLPEKAQEAAVNIADSAKYMALSVEDYLNVSRIEAGNMKYELSDFNLKDTAEKIVDELRPVAMKKGLVMVFRSDCTGSCSVHADIGKTRQVIMNLIDNSMKYTPRGTITVVAHDDVKKKKMYVTIEDTGIGMSKETLEEVFDKFVRAKNANNVNTTGTGLGLFVAKKMVTDMGGRVWAESDGEGKGSRFHIELPLLPGKSMR